MATDPGRPAVITSSGAAVTFAQLEERSCRLAQALFAHGLRSGDHVASPAQRPPDPRGGVGIQRSGLYYTVVNTHLMADEAAYIVNVGARKVITSSGLADWPSTWSPSPPGVGLRLMVGDHR